MRKQATSDGVTRPDSLIIKAVEHGFVVSTLRDAFEPGACGRQWAFETPTTLSAFVQEWSGQGKEDKKPEADWSSEVVMKAGCFGQVASEPSSIFPSLVRLKELQPGFGVEGGCGFYIRDRVSKVTTKQVETPRFAGLVFELAREFPDQLPPELIQKLIS